MNLEHGPATTAPRGSLHPFRLGQILNPYAARYRPPFAFSAFSYPLAQRLPLRVACHSQNAGVGGQLGLTVFRVEDMSRLGSASSPTVILSVSPSVKRDIRLHAFWLKPDSAFGSLLMKTFISSSHSLTDTAQPSTPSALALADNGTLSRACRRSKNGLRCSGGFTPDRYQSSMHR
jgi:hypothetical protein